jgi:hypothetical protein
MTHPALSLIESIAAARARLRGDPHKSRRLHNLQRWQAQRLQRTYADLYAIPRYRAAIEFFVHDLYGPHEYAQRDRDLQRVLEPWQHILPMRAMQAVTNALELEALTQELDLAMIEKLGNNEVNVEKYAAAYRAVNRHNDRKHQIAFIIECGKALDALVANPWVRRALRLAKIPARVAGVSELDEFLERGYEAFAKMQGVQELLNAIELRETTIMNNLFAAHVDPFLTPPMSERIAGSSA